jgi:hypothetical protein
MVNHFSLHQENHIDGLVKDWRTYLDECYAERGAS